MLTYIKKHYHWVVAVIVFLEMIVYGGLINSASVFVQPISGELGVTTTAYSVAMMPYTVTCFIGTCLSGYLFAHFGYKKTATVSLMLISASLVLTANADNLVVFGVSKVLFGMGYAACFTAGSVRVIKDWFWKHQGLVLGAVNMATGLGGSLMTVILSSTIEAKGWRAANYVAAAIIAAVAVLYLLVRDKPESLKLKPFGAGSSLQNTKKARTEDHSFPGYPFAEQLKRPLFYLMCLAVLACCVCMYMVSSFVVPHFRSIGFSGSKAATYQSVYMLVLAGAKLAIGFLYDRFGAKPVMIGCMLCGIVGQGLLGMTTDPVLSLVDILIFAVGLGMTSIMIPLIAAPLFGYKACLSVNGIFLGLSSLSSLFANPLASTCYDRLGVYMPAYRIASIVNIGVLALYLVMFAMSKKDRKRYYEQHPET